MKRYNVVYFNAILINNVEKCNLRNENILTSKFYVFFPCFCSPEKLRFHSHCECAKLIVRSFLFSCSCWCVVKGARTGPGSEIKEKNFCRDWIIQFLKGFRRNNNNKKMEILYIQTFHFPVFLSPWASTNDKRTIVYPRTEEPFRQLSFCYTRKKKPGGRICIEKERGSGRDGAQSSGPGTQGPSHCFPAEVRGCPLRTKPTGRPGDCLCFSKLHSFHPIYPFFSFLSLLPWDFFLQPAEIMANFLTFFGSTLPFPFALLFLASDASESSSSLSFYFSKLLVLSPYFPAPNCYLS